MSDVPTTSRLRVTGVVVGAVLAVLAVIGAVMWVANARTDETPAAGQPTRSAPVETTATTDPPEASSTTDPPEVTESLPPSVDPRPGARDAVEDGVAALVPDRLRRGWVITKATYDARAGLWHLAVTTETGRVDLYQDGSDAAVLVDEYAAGYTRGRPVDLNAFQLGTWARWTGDDGAAISRDLAGGGVVLVADDVASTVEVAESLLTFEAVGGGEQD